MDSFGLSCVPQNKMKELELLCSLKEVPLDCTDPENAVMALRYDVKHILTSCSESNFFSKRFYTYATVQKFGISAFFFFFLRN